MEDGKIRSLKDRFEGKLKEKVKDVVGGVDERISGMSGPNDAKTIAIRHYELLQKNDYEGWRGTLLLWLQEVADRRGSNPDLWWRAGRKNVDELGIHYEYYREEKTQHPNTRKFFFKRKNPDGSDRGMPVPCTVKLDEDGVWRVEQPSY